MIRYYWDTIDEDHALLMGPEEGEVAAVVTMDPGDPELMDSEWRVMSGTYKYLNFREEDTSLPMRQIQRRIIILLGQELSERKQALEDGVASVLELIFEEELEE